MKRREVSLVLLGILFGIGVTRLVPAQKAAIERAVGHSVSWGDYALIAL